MAAAQASAAGVPASLVERVIRRESGGNPRAVHAGNYGLMQIKLGTARAMGYTGSAAGLLDAQTNMTYAVRAVCLTIVPPAATAELRRGVLYASGYYTASEGARLLALMRQPHHPRRRSALASLRRRRSTRPERMAARRSIA